MTTRPAPESQSPAVKATPLRTPSQKATQLALDIAAWLGGCQTEGLAILDVSGPLAIVDYFVVGTVRNTRMAQSIARELDLEMKHAHGRRKRNHGGLEGEDSNWVLLDFDDVVVHLLLPEARAYYDLESLWADAPRVAVPPPREARRRDEPRRAPARHFQIFPADDPK